MKKKYVVPANFCLICGDIIENNGENVQCIHCKFYFHTECERFYRSIHMHKTKECPTCRQTQTLVKK